MGKVKRITLFRIVFTNDWINDFPILIRLPDSAREKQWCHRDNQKSKKKIPVFFNRVHIKIVAHSMIHFKNSIDLVVYVFLKIDLFKVRFLRPSAVPQLTGLFYNGVSRFLHEWNTGGIHFRRVRIRVKN